MGPEIAIRGGARARLAPSPQARRQGWLRRLPLLPALVYVIVITQIPFLLTIYYSLYSWNLLRPGSFAFAGLGNYATVLAGPSFRTAIVNTLVLTVGSVLIAAVLGVGLAVLLNRRFWGRGVVRTLLVAPFLVMPTAAALIWKDTLLSPTAGVVDFVLSPVGLGHFDWVNRLPMPTVIAIVVWQWTPFMMLVVLAGLQSQDLEVLEAARVDGASGPATFRRLTLPHIRPYIELGTLLGSIFIVQTFDTIYITTQGGPGEATTNIPFLLYVVAFQGFDVGQASAIGVISVVLTMVVATFALRTLFTIFHVEARR